MQSMNHMFDENFGNDLIDRDQVWNDSNEDSQLIRVTVETIALNIIIQPELAIALGQGSDHRQESSSVPRTGPRETIISNRKLWWWIQTFVHSLVAAHNFI